jgi:hypothetical protein
MQVTSRSSKQAAKDMDDYLAFYGNVCQILVQIASLCVPSGSCSAEMAENDTVATLAVRTVDTLCAFALNGHLVKMRDANLQNSFLQQLVSFLGSEHLPVAVLTLPAWRRLVQGLERRVNRHEGCTHLFSLCERRRSLCSSFKLFLVAMKDL